MHILRHASHSRFWIYFVEAPSAGMIKIGITGELERRLATLQQSSPVLLSLRHKVRARALHEAALHRMFHEERRHGEWFIASPRLLAFVDDLRGHTVPETDAILDAIADGSPIASNGRRWEQRAFSLTPAGLHLPPRARVSQRNRARRLWIAVERLWREAKAS